MVDLNVFGAPLQPCGTDPMTGFYRDGCCSTGPEDLGSHTICAVVTAEFLAHQRAIGNDLSTPVVLASTHQRALEIVPIEALREHAVDVPDDLAGL